ncbi:hypothetical protein ARMSODRAFT_1022746 [Armillaria solidipes]|uniref:Uncharacterized protein n=1 Tax=Armillaria solidipes TaxID=1076256 RepID=A0A2H3B4Y6_9AGAR|nr:hypothetical protein ARMSODRAFT_1027475 [Armillaria solidipes]PBK64760.1 hypothetical protein ARMSODRAFT_1022746 [Armillaria solidipes]
MTDHRSNAATSADDALLAALVGALQLTPDQHGRMARIMSHVSAGNVAGPAPVHESRAAPAARINTESVERIWASSMAAPAARVGEERVERFWGSGSVGMRRSPTPPDLPPLIPDPNPPPVRVPVAIPPAVLARALSVPPPPPPPSTPVPVPTPAPVPVASAPVVAGGAIPFGPLPANAIVVPEGYDYHVPTPLQRGPYYLVARGLDVGVYAGWEPTAALVIGVSGSIYCKVPSVQVGCVRLNVAIAGGGAAFLP